jgi:hypothetical protein
MLDPNQEISRRDLEMQKLAAEVQYRELKNAQMEGRLVDPRRDKKPWWKSRLLLVGAAAVLHGVWMAHEEGLSIDACLWAGFGAAVSFLRVVTTKILTLTKPKDQK